METTTSEIILSGGPADGEVHREVAISCLMYTRTAKDARYRDTGSTDGTGRRIFRHSPDAVPGRGVR